MTEEERTAMYRLCDVLNYISLHTLNHTQIDKVENMTEEIKGLILKARMEETENEDQR